MHEEKTDYSPRRQPSLHWGHRWHVRGRLARRLARAGGRWRRRAVLAPAAQERESAFAFGGRGRVHRLGSEHGLGGLGRRFWPFRIVTLAPEKVKSVGGFGTQAGGGRVRSHREGWERAGVRREIRKNECRGGGASERAATFRVGRERWPWRPTFFKVAWRRGRRGAEQPLWNIRE